MDIVRLTFVKDHEGAALYEFVIYPRECIVSLLVLNGHLKKKYNVHFIMNIIIIYNEHFIMYSSLIKQRNTTVLYKAVLWVCSEDLFLFKNCSVEKGLCVPYYLHLFLPSSIRWTLPAISIITELLCVEPPRGPWQLTAAERRCVCKWLGRGQKANVLVKLHSKPLSWNSDSQQLHSW